MFSTEMLLIVLLENKYPHLVFWSLIRNLKTSEILSGRGEVNRESRGHPNNFHYSENNINFIQQVSDISLMKCLNLTIQLPFTMAL